MRENFAIINVQGGFRGLVYEYHFGKMRYQRLIEGRLLCNCGRVAVMNETWNGKEQAGFASL